MFKIEYYRNRGGNYEIKVVNEIGGIVASGTAPKKALFEMICWFAEKYNTNEIEEIKV